MLRIDGSYGEGGGQLLRTALALAAITGREVHIGAIRAGREKPGLRAQHLTAVRAVADVCAASVEGAVLGSRSVTLTPTTPPRPGRYRWDVGTAGAVSLVLQTVLWPLAFAAGRSEVTLEGGTHVQWSPPVDYLQRVYLPLLDGLVVAPGGGCASPYQAGREHPAQAPPPVAGISIERWGWYPRGGGLIRASIPGCCRLRPLTLMERGSLREVSVLSAASNLPDHIRQRQADRADFLLRKRGIVAQIDALDPPSPGQGTVVFVLAEYRHPGHPRPEDGRVWAGFTGYGRLRKPAERVAEEACKAFLRYHKRGHPVDAHLADQLLLPLSFAAYGDGSSRACYAVESVTRHLSTQAWVIQQFFDDVRIEVHSIEGQPGMVTIEPCALPLA